MKMIPGFVFLLFILASCSTNNTNDIIIEGDVKNIPDGKVYLTEAHKWNVPLDSAICSKGHFIFHIKPDSSFVPYLAAIHFPDSSNLSTKTGSLFFRNYMNYDSLTNAAEGFYVEKGYTSITGDNKAKAHLRIFAAGKETDLLFKYGFYFGSLGSNDSATMQHIFEYYKAEIKKHPSSYFF
jgi:hypothetical protein